MKNSQVVALSAVILAAALLVVGGNWLVVRSLRQELREIAGGAGPKASARGAPSTSPSSR